ncbi:MAG: hypothetical protein QOI56_670, partial [Actinomycetota bacterium]|nr:hypothetical protein [Actinomycetota bacterium]
IFDVEAGCRPHEKIPKGAIVPRNEPVAVEPVAVEHPLRQQQGCALVAFSKALRTGDPVRELGRGVDRVVDLVDGSKRPLNPVEIVWIIEPFLIVTNGAIEGDGNREGRPPQCSRR